MLSKLMSEVCFWLCSGESLPAAIKIVAGQFPKGLKQYYADLLLLEWYQIG